ncbi:glucose-6-phosphate dehydrogenase [Pseudorhodobacter sp.]|uniref:glucose-6-phosphate dehydrogenase n=1 Tax=Pseudorhodobacter sp. TaxID=1934400 RepID=UPI0026485AF5|nr:glucose-6-phosphate dehydrogenase [Pseudorhodobacter sp.]MDN5788170.1 glucose-6-phosphate dehydrogenase [Pseudorhodobacter sp.]
MRKSSKTSAHTHSAVNLRNAPHDDAPAAPVCTMVIFGAAGDLTKRLVVPALYNLVNSGRLADGFRLVGVDHSDQTTQSWRDGLGEMMQDFVSDTSGEFHAASINQAHWKWLTERMSYLQGDFQDPATFHALSDHLDEVAGQRKGPDNRLFYLAVADRFFETVVNGLSAADLVRQDGDRWRRVVIEKPFGHDLASAKVLNTAVLKVLREDQVFRMDHFLGKETVQNIMALRFANGLFEPIWNRDHIDQIQITAAETVGVEARGKFYERTGALRDMVPNHMFQLLSMVAMEPPTSFDADAVRNRKSDVIGAIEPMDPAQALASSVRAQYAAGTVAGHKVRAYRNEPDVDAHSMTETYAALRLGIENWRWAGVPFYLRTGKCMSTRQTEIAIRFHQAPYALFRGTDVAKMHPNWMILRIQPDEGIALEFAAKRPGPTVKLSTVDMDFSYSDFFAQKPSTGYETLLYDCMMGDATLFQRADTVENGWRAVDPVLEAWADAPQKTIPQYAAGSDGPKAADDLLQASGHAWRALPLS